MAQDTKADHLNKFDKVKIQKLLNRQKRGDRPTKRKANVELSNTEENQVKKIRGQPLKAKSALNIDKLIKMTNFYMLYLLNLYTLLNYCLLILYIYFFMRQIHFSIKKYRKYNLNLII